MPFLALVYVDDHTADVIMERHSLETTEGRIVGLYEFPPKDELVCRGFCMRKGLNPWTRHRQGHMICAVCRGRHVHTRRRLVGALFDYLGLNIIKREKTPRVFRNPDGWN